MFMKLSGSLKEIKQKMIALSLIYSRIFLGAASILGIRKQSLLHNSCSELMGKNFPVIVTYRCNLYPEFLVSSSA